MKEPYAEGLATHGAPESCAGSRKGAGEALTGAQAGRVLSRENTLTFGVPTVWTCRKATPVGCLAEEGRRGRKGKSKDTIPR
jgi:hypothetical protein